MVLLDEGSIESSQGAEGLEGVAHSDKGYSLVRLLEDGDVFDFTVWREDFVEILGIKLVVDVILMDNILLLSMRIIVFILKEHLLLQDSLSLVSNHTQL
jgi:hypothetical protein